MPRPIRATVSASALAHNLAVARRYAGEAKLWAVIKANAYGHGLVRAAQALAGADGFAVLDFVEALKLRHAGVSAPILMLEGFFQPEDIALVVSTTWEELAAIDERTIHDHLYQPSLPDPDLLIRTAGEQRISNFLLWQISYAEIWVTDVLWPDFRRRHLLQAVLDFQKRERRYGGIKPA